MAGAKTARARGEQGPERARTRFRPRVTLLPVLDRARWSALDDRAALHAPVAAQRVGSARQGDGGAKANIPAGDRHLQLVLAGLDDAAALGAREREHVRWDLEGDPGRLPRPELDPAEGLELLDRTH